MELNILDIIVFITFFCIVIAVSMYKSRKERTGEEYFLAGRTLLWPFIGLSMIAANISTEQFVGMSGQGARDVGLAIASYEWMAAVTMVIVTFFFLPKFLKAGIFTFPEYLEYRYTPAARSLMAFYTMLIYVFVLVASVLYSGGLTIATIFEDTPPLLGFIELNLTNSVILIGVVATIYTVWGGLKAVAWADLFLGSSLIIGGAIALFFGFQQIGVTNFFQANTNRLHMILPHDNSVLPWTALLLGLWIPNFYYWSVNQFIAQRTLAAKSLKEGQLGVLFAACLKLLTPFLIVFPGIMAWQLYSNQMHNPDQAFPILIKNLIPAGISGFMFAAIAGAVISSLASMLNSAATVFTMDLVKRRFWPDASQTQIVRTGRIATIAFVIIGCAIAPLLGHPALKGIFTYIQEFQGFISPGILAAFVVALIFKRAPRSAGLTALILNPIIYGLLLVLFGSIPVFEPCKLGSIAFLNRMALTFGIILLSLTAMTILNPLDKPVLMPERRQFDMTTPAGAKWLGAAIILATITLYIIFW